MSDLRAMFSPHMTGSHLSILRRVSPKFGIPAPGGSYRSICCKHGIIQYDDHVEVCSWGQVLAIVGRANTLSPGYELHVDNICWTLPTMVAALDIGAMKNQNIFRRSMQAAFSYEGSDGEQVVNSGFVYQAISPYSSAARKVYDSKIPLWYELDHMPVKFDGVLVLDIIKAQLNVIMDCDEVFDVVLGMIAAGERLRCLAAASEAAAEVEAVAGTTA